MKKFFKFLLWLLAIIIVLVVVAYLTAGIWVKSIVSTVVPQMTKTAASLQKADISLLSGRVSLQGFKIANPAGFVNPNAFELGEVSVKFEPKSIFTSKIIINEVIIKGTKVDAEFSKDGNVNLMVLNDNVQRYLGNPTVTSQPKPEEISTQSEKKTQDKAVVIRDLQINDSSLNFGLLGKTTTVPLPNIREKNIGEKKKTTLKDVFYDIFFNKLTVDSLKKISQSGQEAVGSMLNSLAQQTKNATAPVKDLKNQLKSLF